MNMLESVLKKIAIRYMVLNTDKDMIRKPYKLKKTERKGQSKNQYQPLKIFPNKISAVYRICCHHPPHFASDVNVKQVASILRPELFILDRPFLITFLATGLLLYSPQLDILFF